MEKMQSVITSDAGRKLNTQKTARHAGVELLRSIAMLMVITLHYLDKGGVLVSLTEKQGVSGYLAWLLEAFCIVAVNTYVLVSGYFLTEAGFKLKRLVQLVCQLLFYSILVPVVLVLAGQLPASRLTLYDLLNYFLPVQMNHYWFGTAYVLMYLFVPVLSAGVRNLSKKQLGFTILTLLLVFSVSKSVLPFQLAIDRQGYDVVWFLCLFLVAAYLRLYGAGELPGRKGEKPGCSAGFFLYIAGGFGIFLLSLILAFLSSRFGKFAYFVESPYQYNHILCLLAAIGLFYGFLNVKLSEGKVAALARWLGPYTFGVYLLHENISIRYLWPAWVQALIPAPGGTWILQWLAGIFMVFAAGILIDFLRSRLFAGAEALFSGKHKGRKNEHKGE